MTEIRIQMSELQPGRSRRCPTTDPGGLSSVFCLLFSDL